MLTKCRKQTRIPSWLSWSLKAVWQWNMSQVRPVISECAPVWSLRWHSNIWHQISRSDTESEVSNLTTKYLVMWEKIFGFFKILCFKIVSRGCHDHVTKLMNKLELESTMSQSRIEFWNLIFNLNQSTIKSKFVTLTWINLSWLFKSTGGTAE